MFRNRIQRRLWDVCLPARSDPSEDQGGDSTSTSDDDPENTVQVVDNDIDIVGPVLILRSESIGTVYMSCPSDATRELGIVLPILGLLVKPHVDEYFAVEVLVRDQCDHLYRLRATNVQTQVYQTSKIALVPLRLVPGWNQVQFDLRSVLFQVYGAGYRETVRVTIHANGTLRRVYFAERPGNELDLPQEFRLHQRETLVSH
ncbi:hypothetical protein IWQ61_005140 [Dispira simplex]|nr:hypothetical protein IWQ61_005140 [Dispira simplex]